MPELLLGADHLTALELTPAAFTEAAAAAGFASVSLRTIHVVGGEPAWADEPVNTGAISRRAADGGVRVHAIEAVAITPQLASSMDALRGALEEGAELGAELLYSFADDTDPVRCAETFALLAETAHQFGLRTLLEPMPYRAVATLGQASGIVSGAGHDAGLIVDTLHASRGGTTAADLAAFPANQLAVLQLCDAPALAPSAPSPSGLHPLMHEARFNRLVPGAGELPLAAFAKAMPAGAIIAVEAPSSAGVEPSQHLASLHAAVRQSLAQGDAQ